MWSLYFHTVWDLRLFKKPVSVKMEMMTLYPQTNATFSPDDKYVVTSVRASSEGGHGKLLFMSKDSLEIVKELMVDSGPVKVVWHSKINQVSWSILPLHPPCDNQDRDEIIQWSNLRAVLPDILAEWGQTAVEQGSTKEGNNRGHVGRSGPTGHHHAACTADVQGGRDRTGHGQEEAREGEAESR
jgi:hypothetical protein